MSSRRRLALRLAGRVWLPRGTAEIVATTWLVLASALTVASLLVSIDLMGSLAERATILAERTPLTGRSAGNPLAIADDYHVGDAHLLRLAVSPGEHEPDPFPGLQRWPAPGEVFASPSAQRLIATNPYAAALVPGRVVGTVGAPALRDPDEAYVVIGRTRAELAADPSSSTIIGFGQHDSILVDITDGGLARIALISTALLMGAIVVLAHTVTRLSGRARARRLAVLQLLGSPTSVTAAIAFWTTAALAGAGAIIGSVGVAALVRGFDVWQFAGTRWWSGSGWLNGYVATFVCLVTVLLIARRARPAYAGDAWAQRRDEPEAPPSPYRIVPIFFSSCVLAGVLVAEQANAATGRGLNETGFMLFIFAVVGILVGLPICAPVLVRWGGGLARRVGPLGLRLAGARAMHRPRTAARLVSGLMVLTITSGLTLGFWTVAETRPMPEGPVLTLQIDALGDETWQRRLAAELATDPKVITLAAVRANADVLSEEIHRPADIRRDDLGYSVTLAAADAIALAARIERAHPGQQPALFDYDFTTPRALVLGGTAILTVQALCTLLIALSLAATLLTLQTERSSADTMIMLIGMTRTQARRVRAAEVLIIVVPGVALAAVIGTQLARGIAHVDHPDLLVPMTWLLGLAGSVLALSALFGVAAAAATPRFDPALVRKD